MNFFKFLQRFNVYQDQGITIRGCRALSIYRTCFTAQDSQLLPWSHIWFIDIESNYSRNRYSPNSRLWNFKLPWYCAPFYCGLESLLWSPAVLRTPDIHALCLIEIYKPKGIAIIGTFITFYCLSFQSVSFSTVWWLSKCKSSNSDSGTSVAWTPDWWKLWDNRDILF